MASTKLDEFKMLVPPRINLECVPVHNVRHHNVSSIHLRSENACYKFRRAIRTILFSCGVEAGDGLGFIISCPANYEYNDVL